MKKLVKKKGTECMACLECVNECSKTFYKEFDPGKSHIQIVLRKGEAQPAVCIQCGKCAKACTSEAITQNAKGVYLVNKKACTGCGACVEACPLHIMVLVPEVGTASKCIACGKCVKICPMEILEVVED